MTADDRTAYDSAVASGRYRWVIGADECGYGSWGGPLMVCAAATRVEWTLQGLRDSKKCSLAKREGLFPRLHGELEYVPVMTAASEIDRLGIKKVLMRSFKEAVHALLRFYPEALVVLDGDIQFGHHLHFPKADDIVPAVSAASVLGKVIRDRWMKGEAHQRFPQYGFDAHMGYGTPQHREALEKYGPCELHRQSYQPIKSLLRSGNANLHRGQSSGR